MNENMVMSARNLATGYDGRIIIPDMTMTIPAGKISVLIGANGCGKSTLLKAFCRLNRVYAGTITLGDRDIRDYGPKEYARSVGMLPQSPAVPEGISVRELVTRGRFPYRQPLKGLAAADYQAVDRAIAVMGIEAIADRNVDELSGGQRQRVWIALSLAQETDILFLDEPTTFLDISYQIEILELLVRLNRENRTTIVMVLHDINLAARYADYLFAMKQGQLIREGKPADIIDEALIREVYGMESRIITDPVYGTPNVIPVGNPSLLRE